MLQCLIALIYFSILQRHGVHSTDFRVMIYIWDKILNDILFPLY